jgi:hypothetical protein
VGGLARGTVRQGRSIYIIEIYPVLWIQNDFPDPSFELVPDPDPVSGPPGIFSNILNKNFTFAFPSCKCIWLHISRDISFLRKIFTL